MGCTGKVEAEMVVHLAAVAWYDRQDVEVAALVLVGRLIDTVGSMSESPLDISPQPWHNQ
jgi:hypothetical protein